ncbi:hypothetical protein HMPREF3224_01183 [Anaerococcus hydrogenalis]|nr:hypothetical protein HMPREF3224_01183 [Anaerococcus hydrogenalis]
MSGLEPDSFIISGVNIIKIAEITIHKDTETIMAVTMVWFAIFLSSSPFLLATSAETETAIAIKIERAINFGWVVSPIAATADEPIDETMKVSIKPAKEIKNDSKTDGQAICRALFRYLFFIKKPPYFL